MEPSRALGRNTATDVGAPVLGEPGMRAVDDSALVRICLTHGGFPASSCWTQGLLAGCGREPVDLWPRARDAGWAGMTLPGGHPDIRP